jgi:hypothetical protein
MKKIKLLTIIALSVVAALAAACSSGTTTNTTTTNATGANKPAANTAVVTNTGATNSGATTTGEKPGEETPASVKAAFPDAQSFTKQHKDLSKDQIADIEKDAGAKLSDTDHHSYLAFSTAGGARKQIGAATVVEAGGRELVVVYDSKNGSPVIKEIRADSSVPAAFLAQFAGKGHDSPLKIGSDLKANGLDDATAKAIADAVRVDAMTMQTLYGASHAH